MHRDQTTVAQFSLPAGQFPLGAVFETWPDARIELDRVVPSNGSTMPYFWVSGVDGESVQALLEDLPQFESVTVTDDLGDRGLLRAEWSAQSLGLMHSILESDVTLLSAVGTTDGWTFELRGDSRRALAEFMQRCAENDVPVEMSRIRNVETNAPLTEQLLTDGQREALLLAFTEGYYEEPRQTDLQSLAERVGISRQAFSSRLRRSYRNIISSTLVDN